ncbi:glycosyltransferase family 61 protein [Brevundimonas sp.]|uniref:glycosyltransferase family 61 protein n=1 Tax=Brevundimonas sp. TaxID=1871086 RepID=UPI003D0C90D1
MIPHVTWEDDDFRDYVQGVVSVSEVVCPDEGYFEMADVFVYDSKHIFVGDAFEPITTVDFAAQSQVAESVRIEIARDAYQKIASRDRLDVIFCKSGADNFGHFLAECAPRLLNLAAAGLGPVRLHMPYGSAMFADLVLRVCAALAIDAELRIGKLGDLIRVERAVYMSAVSSHNTRKSRTFKLFRDVVISIFNLTQSYDRRIVITRSPSEGRNIRNWDAIAPIFSDFDYEVLFPGAMSFRQQVSTFAAVGRLVGTLGAGFTNCMWAGADCKTMMFDPGLSDFFFWDIAGQMGQEFRWCFSGTAQRWNEALSVSDFSIDVDVLRQQLSELG